MVKTDAELLRIDKANRITALENRSFIVEAPAGAGKTELLTQRYLKLLQTVDTPEEIIAITFTNKAASEMRLRIFESLRNASIDNLPKQPHKQITFKLAKLALEHSQFKNWKLLDNPSRLRITTIDALCGNIARQMPLLSRFGSQPTTTENANLHYLEAANRTLAMLENNDSITTIIASALSHLDNNAESLRKLLVAMLDKRDQWLNYAQQILTIDHATLAQLLEDDLKPIYELLNPKIQYLLMPLVHYALANLPNDHVLHQLQDWNTCLEPTIEQIKEWRILCGFLLTEKGTWRKSVNVNHGFPATDETKPLKAQLIEIINQIAIKPNADIILLPINYLPNLPQDEKCETLIKVFSQLLNIAVAHLWQVFQESNEVDFTGIQQRTLLALEDDDGATDLALKLDYKISHLLVDEFQDTSPTQINLLKALTRGWENDDGRTLFCVGDPMQSIYRFRKADVSLFLHAAKFGIGDIQLDPLKLYQNNRSHPEVVNWINYCFSQIFPIENNAKQAAIAYSPFVACKPHDINAGVTIYPVLYTEHDDDVQLEAMQAIAIIQKTQSEKPSAKIAVLVRAKNHLSGLVQEIRRNHPNLHFQAVEVEPLSGRQSVQDILALTHALFHLADRVNWLAILRAPWCGLILSDLHRLCADNHHQTIWALIQDESRIATMTVDGQLRINNFKKIMAIAIHNKARQTHKRWIESVWLKLNGPACLWEASDIKDIQAFLNLIARLERNQQLNADNLQNEVEKLFATPDTLANESLQFMSIHKSKGLEFDTVILLGLDHKTNNEDKPLLLWEEITQENAKGSSQLVAAPLIPKTKKMTYTPDLYDYLHHLEKLRSQNENLRVLYVAATRAERHLHIVVAAKVKEKRGELLLTIPAKNTPLGDLWPVVNPIFTEKFNAYKLQKHTKNEPDIVTFIPKLLRLKTVYPRMIPLNDVATQIKSHVVNLTNSSQITTQDEGLTKNNLVKDTGNLAHLYMELIAKQGIEKWPHSRFIQLKNAMGQWFKQRGYNNQEILAASDQVFNALTTTINSKDGRWVLQLRESGRSELALQTDNRSFVVDRTFIEDNIRWIIDFKLTNFEVENKDLQTHAERYHHQLDNYAALFMHENIPIKKAIFYLSFGKLIILNG